MCKSKTINRDTYARCMVECVKKELSWKFVKCQKWMRSIYWLYVWVFLASLFSSRSLCDMLSSSTLSSVIMRAYHLLFSFLIKLRPKKNHWPVIRLGIGSCVTRSFSFDENDSMCATIVHTHIYHTLLYHFDKFSKTVLPFKNMN